jgi:ankyrin repeat protein
MAMTQQDFLRAAFDGDLERLREYVESGGDIDATNRHGMSALMLAIWNGRERAVAEYLVDRGIDLSLRQPSSQWRALTFAAVNGHEDLLAMLLERGDRPDPQGADWKALSFAVQYRNSATAAMLLERGAEVDAPDEDGRTPLMRAARNGDPVALELMLRHGADARAADREGNTALHFAAAKASLDNVRTLIEHGGDPAARNAAGESPIDIARAKRKPKIAAALESFAGAT